MAVAACQWRRYVNRRGRWRKVHEAWALKLDKAQRGKEGGSSVSSMGERSATTGPPFCPPFQIAMDSLGRRLLL